MSNFCVYVECAIECDGKFLIIKRPANKQDGAGLLSLPGGTVEPQDGVEGDILRNAIRREILEEVGLTLENPIGYITSTCFVSGSGTPVVGAIFYCKLEKGVQVIASEREVPEYHWMTATEINQAEGAPVWLKGYFGLINKS